jgi:hypothetical protein
MTAEQADLLIAEVSGLKIELAALMDAQSQALIELHSVGMGLGTAVGVVAGLMCAKIWAVTFRI